MRRCIKFWCIIIVLLNTSCNNQYQKINGVSFVASPNKINPINVKQVTKNNANYVALMPFGFIKDLSSPEIIHNTDRQWFGETEKGVVQYAEEFKKANVKLMIKPHIWVWRGEFTGNIVMKSENEWEILEDSYTEFILTYAKTADFLNADIFCIGVELEQFVKNRPEYWIKLIAQIRKVYQGKLTYAANWDEYTRTPFWKQLDYIGIDAYFPLSDKKTPSIQEFEKGWEKHKQQINYIRNKVNKPVLFTEYGYRSVDFSGKEPWNSDRIEGNVNLKNQENALQAIYNQFWKEDWFAGGFIWKWFHNSDKIGGVDNNRFTPQNKPAEKILSKAYKDKN